MFQINWIQLLNERKINFNPLGPLSTPKMCKLLTNNRQKEACTKFYQYIKGGRIVICGNNRNGRRNDSPTNTDYIAIACGHLHSIALKNDGRIVTWGNNEDDQRNDSPIDAGYIAIECGYNLSVALRQNGTI